MRYWRENGLRSAAAGTALHAVVERWMNAKIDHTQISLEDEDELVLVQYKKFLEEIVPAQFEGAQLVPRRSEWRIWDEINGFCGTVDAVFENKRTGGLWLVDWKRTLKSLDPNDSRKGWDKKDVLIPTLGRLDNNHNKYLVQLSIYAHIFRTCYDIEFKKILLVGLYPEVVPQVHAVTPLGSDELLHRFPPPVATSVCLLGNSTRGSGQGTPLLGRNTNKRKRSTKKRL
jgi:hypothetical protein